jgi:uncharacterized repeat protein (TIGR03803 family)
MGGSMTGICGEVGGCGTVFRLSQQNGTWVYTLLYEFLGGFDGQWPQAALTIGPDGALYGTTVNGGQDGCSDGYGCGVLFKLTPPGPNCHSTICRWTESVVFDFAWQSQSGISSPYGGVIFDEAGNIYGTAFVGGLGICSRACGAVYELTPHNGTWSMIPLYRFTGNNDGDSPKCTLLRDRQGNLYGTASAGGRWQSGTVFELIRSGRMYRFNLLYTFRNEEDGSLPTDGLVMDSSGALYGDTPIWGTNGGGAVFQLTPTGSGWNFAVLYSPTGGVSGPLTIDGAGNLYGTTAGGGAARSGSLFELSRSGEPWVEHDLYSFGTDVDQIDGALPYGGVTMDNSGNFYGTTKSGGRSGAGVAWEFTQ